MKTEEFIKAIKEGSKVKNLLSALADSNSKHIQLKGLKGSFHSVIAAISSRALEGTHVFILNDKETAAYFYNDLESIYQEKDQPYAKKKILYFPTSYKRTYDSHQTDKSNALSRTEVLNRLNSAAKRKIVVTYPEALCEKIVARRFLSKNSIKINSGEDISLDFIIDVLNEYGFEREDFVVQPGQFAVRGGIVDVFSYSNDYPFRIEFFGDEVESIRSFDPASQLSLEKFNRISILPDVHDKAIDYRMNSFLSFLAENSRIWIEDITFAVDAMDKEFGKVLELYQNQDVEGDRVHPRSSFTLSSEFISDLAKHIIIEFGRNFAEKEALDFIFDQSPQPSFNKNFELLIADLQRNNKNGIKNFIFSENLRQLERLEAIFEDVAYRKTVNFDFDYEAVNQSLHEGFIDRDSNVACYTDHQIFERYHKYNIKDSFSRKEQITLKELYDLQRGDYVTHIDHGVGRFDGLEKIDNNGKQQEAIRLIYKNSDLLYVSIHSLHRIAKYVGKEGSVPRVDKLGSNAWNKLKAKTKKKVKDIAKDLIKLYAERKSKEGFQFSPDTYLQNELEASFIYEDTPDQSKSTQLVKKDMESTYPMDRLICGDVGFGKTEIAIRAAFKAVADSKQVAVLVPTTILALQHYNTFRDRLKDFPCEVDYINRFKSAKQQKETKEKLQKGDIDILIGTHRLISKDIKFKELGLQIIDEEQKFGVAAKEKLKQIKINVDTLTLTATPIPRTLQFSMMSARDLSVINTPPPNRYPVQTEIRGFNDEIIRDAIYYEVNRGGQVFFVHNRVQNIHDVEQMIHKFCPDVKIAVAHGQMDGKTLEKVMLDFINQAYDVLLATTIIESGLDIPNVNTIIINDAQNYGLSDLHQLRGRVGRTNKKAFCYLLAPSLSVLTPEARNRLKAIEEFSELGSGFNIALRDLDIRGAGNILGAEQSGFISEIGFEMYQKILDEAITELKENEFKEYFAGEEKEKEYVKDTQIETDLELLIPDNYITNIAERLSVYRYLDNIDEELELQQYILQLEDRFGPVPESVEGLSNAIRLRWKARKAGFEKLILKNSKMIIHFVSNQESPYYKSSVFAGILNYVQMNPRKCAMKEKSTRLSLTVMNIRSVKEAISVISDVLDVN